MEVLCDNTAQKQYLETEFDDYRNKYKELTMNWIMAHSKCASSLITSPSNFNVAQNNQANELETRCNQARFEWAKTTQNRIKQAILSLKTEDARIENEWQILKTAILNKLDDQIQLLNMLERVAKRGEVELTKRSLELVKYNNLPDLVEMAQEAAKQRKMLNCTTPTEIRRGKGYKVVQNPGINKIQFFFDNIPDEPTRNWLKKNGFKWTNQTWQRQLTKSTLDLVNNLPF
jgi:hypothetical protein